MVKKPIEEPKVKVSIFHKIADFCADNFGKPAFLGVHIVWWTLWMIFSGFDPFPFQLLTLIVSLESILLSGLILNATSREGIKDRATIEKDLRIDRSSHELIFEIHKELLKTKRTRGGKDNGIKESESVSSVSNDKQSEAKQRKQRKSVS